MARPSRKMRQCVVASVFFVLLLLTFFGMYRVFFRVAPTCFDGKQNQNEQGIDCGGVCTVVCQETAVGENLQFKEVAFVQGGDKSYDVLGRVYNPNDVVGASTFHYVFELKDADGKVLTTRSGESFILPQETKSLIEIKLVTEEQPAVVTMKISDVVWEHFSGYRERPAINIYQKRYNQLSTGVGFGEAFGLVVNESQYDFRSIYVNVILRDVNGKPLAFNTTRQDTLKASDQRDFRLLWPNPFPGTVENVDMEVDADVYHSENFIQQYFPGGKLF